MRPRMRLARFCIQLGDLIKSLALMLMKPKDLVDFSREMSYEGSQQVEKWGREEFINKGLNDSEISLLEKLPLKTGRLLLLGVGGGRDAIPLLKSGFDVTGVDYVAEMVDNAQENAARQGLHLDGLVQEISELQLPKESYDVIWFSGFMYSCVPTQKRRVAMLQNLKNALAVGGYVVCQFWWQTFHVYPSYIELLRKSVAILSLGNLSYQKGDMLWLHRDFIHAFLSECEIREEFEAGGFQVFHLILPETGTTGGTILKAI